jgi:hypothetical protein
MALIKLYPNELKKFIRDLRGFVVIQDHERQEVINCQWMNRYPVDGLEDWTDSNSVIYTRSVALDGIAADLETRLDEAILMNSNGLTATDDVDVAYYYLPDDAADTASNVTLYNSTAVSTAQSDAQAVREHMRDGELEGPSWNALMAKIQENADNNSVYAAQFVRSAQSDYLMDLPLNIQGDNEEISEDTQVVLNTLSVVYQSASMLYDTPSGDSAANWSIVDDINAAVTQKGHQGRATVLDAILNNENVDSPYDTEFLLDLAAKMEEYDEWLSVTSRAVANYTIVYYSTEADDGSRLLLGYSTDGLAAAVGAMGKNPEAAVAYFTAVPGDVERYDDWTPKPELNSRWTRLTERLGRRGNGYPEVAFTRLTAGLAGASALRQPPSPREDTDERAAWITGQAVNYLSGECVESSVDRAKTNVGVIVGNCAQELTSDVTGADGYTSEEEPYRLAPITSDPKFKETLWGLINSISGSDNAISALGQGTVVYAFNRATTWSNEKTREGQDLDEKTSDDKQSDIAHVFHDEQYLIDKIDEEVRGGRNSKGDFNLASAGANAAAVLITLVPEGGAVVGSVLQAGLSLAQIIPADDAANPSVSASGLNASIIQAAINTGAIDESGLTDAPWYVPPKSGEAHGHINLEGTVKVDSEEISRAASFQGWVNTTSLIINNQLRQEAQGS